MPFIPHINTAHAGRHRADEVDATLTRRTSGTPATQLCQPNLNSALFAEPVRPRKASFHSATFIGLEDRSGALAASSWPSSRLAASWWRVAGCTHPAARSAASMMATRRAAWAMFARVSPPGRARIGATRQRRRCAARTGAGISARSARGRPGVSWRQGLAIVHRMGQGHSGHSGSRPETMRRRGTPPGQPRHRHPAMSPSRSLTSAPTPGPA